MSEYLKTKKKQGKQENGLGIGEVHFTMFFESLEQFQNLEFVSESLKFVLSDLFVSPKGTLRALSLPLYL